MKKENPNIQNPQILKEISSKWNDPTLNKEKYDRLALEEKERYDREVDALQKEKDQEQGFEFPPNGTYKPTENMSDFNSLVQASFASKPETHTYRERRLSSVFQEHGNGFTAGGFFGHKHSIDMGNDHLTQGPEGHVSPYLSVPSMIHHNVISPEPRVRQDSFYDDFMKSEKDQPKFKFRHRSDSAFSDFNKDARNENNHPAGGMMDMRDANEFPTNAFGRAESRSDGEFKSPNVMPVWRKSSDVSPPMQAIKPEILSADTFTGLKPKEVETP